MEYLSHLSSDKKLIKAIGSHEPVLLKKKKDIALHLVASIMSQQLSTKVAQVIYSRFLTIYGGKNPDPEMILKTKPEVLRSIGLSNAKVAYVQNVARFAAEKGIDYKKLNRMSNDEVIEYLTQIKGVGRWTVEMQLMFTMGREDVFPSDDLGIRLAMESLYKLDSSDKKAFNKRIHAIAEKWSPYRTYACLHLWKWRDEKKKK